jgi:isoleucyl-tRNA synthetase
MHELYVLETKARESYENFNIHSGMTVLSTRIFLLSPNALVVQSLTTFSNSALSALYFDVAKDVLYADEASSVSRRAVLTVLDKV